MKKIFGEFKITIGAKKPLFLLIRGSSAFFVTLIFITVLIAPLFSFTLSTPSISSEISDPTAQEIDDEISYEPDIEYNPGYFDPDDYAIADYSRTSNIVINRGSDINPEDLLFGSADVEDMEGGLKAPPDMTFKDDNTTMYVHSTTLNMRDLPTTDAQVLYQYKRSESFTRTGIGVEWSRVINSAGVVGYVFNSYIGSAKPTPSPTPKPKYTAPAQANTLGGAIALEAQKYLGVKYVWSAEDPNIGFDCSGLTWYVFKRYGISTPRSTNNYNYYGTPIAYDQMAPGDVITWDTEKNDGRTAATHVGIYIGGGMMVHASTSNGKVVVANVAQYARLCTLISIQRFY